MPLMNNPLSLLQQSTRQSPARRGSRLLPEDAELEGVNAPATLREFQGAQEDETFDRLYKAVKGGPSPTQAADVGGLQMLLGRQQGQIAASPIEAQRKEVDQFGADSRAALNEGFGMGPQSPEPNVNPVASRNIYKRKMEQEKMRQPISLQQMEETGATQRQRIATGGLADVARINAENDIDVANIQTGPQNSYQELQRALLLDEEGNPRGAGGGQNLKSVGKSSMSFQSQPNPNPILQQGNVIMSNMGARQLYVNDTDPSPEQRAYNSHVATVLSQTPIPPEAKQDIMNIMRDPQKSQWETEAIFNDLFDVSQLDPNDRAALTDLFLKIRGR